MKLFNLMTYQQYITKNKGYKHIGKKHYYNYCEIMTDYARMLIRNNSLDSKIEENTKSCYRYYKLQVNPNFKG